MNRPIQWNLLLSLANRGVTLLVSLLLGLQLATPARAFEILNVAQQPEGTSQDPKRAAAEKAVTEAEEMRSRSDLESQKAALAKYSEARQLYQTLGDRIKEADILDNIALIYWLKLSEKQKALDSYNQALTLYLAESDKDGEAKILHYIAEIYSELGNTQSSLDYYNQSLIAYRASGDRDREAYALSELGEAYFKFGDKQKSLDYYNQTLIIYRASGYKDGEVSILNAIANVYAALAEKQKQLDIYNQLLIVYRQLGNSEQQAYTLYSIASVYSELGETQKQLDTYNQMLPLWQALNNRSVEASTLRTIGSLYAELGDKQKALDYYQRAQTMYRAAGIVDEEASTIFAIAKFYSDFGEKPQALNYLNQALSEYLTITEPSEKARRLVAIGDLYLSLDEKQKAFDFFNQALILYRQAGVRDREASTLAIIAYCYGDSGDKQKALDTYNQVLTVYQAIGDKDGEATTLNHIAELYADLGEKQKALDFYNRSLGLWQTLNNKFYITTTLNSIGNLYYDLGEKQQSLNYYNQALSLLRDVRDRYTFPTVSRIGDIYSDLGEKQKALDSYKQALSMLRDLPVLDYRNDETTKLLSKIARLERDRGNLKESLVNMEEVIKIIEDKRSQIRSSQSRASYFASAQNYYEFYLDLLMQLHKQNPSQGYDSQALQASERTRARALLEVLAEANTDIRSGINPVLAERKINLQQQINDRAEKLAQLPVNDRTEAQVVDLQKEINNLLNKYEEVEDQIRTTNPHYAALTKPQPLTLSQIQQEVLNENTLLLEYFIGDERSYLWAISNTSISSYELPKRADIEAVTKQFRDALTVPAQRNNLKLISNASNALSQIILKPVADRLGSKRLLIVADGVLQYIPFSAIASPNKPDIPLIVEREIINLPSASTLAILRRDTSARQKAPKTLAVLADPVFGSNDERFKGNPASAIPNDLPVEAQQLQRAATEAGILWNRLPFTETEAKQILALVPDAEKRMAFGFAANRSTATSEELSQYRIVHFATHGFANSDRPELSGLVLSLIDEKGALQNGYLRLHDIYNLNLPAELVVLSACQTGLGKDIKGEGLVGLTRGFMYAGAPRVVVSLWSVNDQATSELMVKFYQKMLKDGLAPSAALRAAQVELLQQTEWKSPYYWAAFGLQGEWK